MPRSRIAASRSRRAVNERSTSDQCSGASVVRGTGRITPLRSTRGMTIPQASGGIVPAGPISWPFCGGPCELGVGPRIKCCRPARIPGSVGRGIALAIGGIKGRSCQCQQLCKGFCLGSPLRRRVAWLCHVARIAIEVVGTPTGFRACTPLPRLSLTRGHGCGRVQPEGTAALAVEDKIREVVGQDDGLVQAHRTTVVPSLLQAVRCDDLSCGRPGTFDAE